MSSIKFCDRHGGPFPAGQEGSAKVNVEINRRYDSGEKYIEHENWDFCPTCTALMESPKAGMADPAKVNSMEAQLGMQLSPPETLQNDGPPLHSTGAQ